MRSLPAATLESLLSRDLTLSVCLVLGGTTGYGTRRSANTENMPRAQELTVNGVVLLGDSIVALPTITETTDLSADTLTIGISPRTGSDLAADALRHQASPPNATYPSKTAKLYLCFGEGPDYLTSDGTALLIWQGLATRHTFQGGGNILTLALEPLWARLAEAPLLRYDPQDQYRLFAGDTGLDHTPATRRKLALSTGTATPAASQDASLLQAPHRQLVLGTQIVAGEILLLATSGASSRYANLIVSFAAHEVAALERIWLDDREVEFTSGDTVGGNFAATLTVSRKLGTTSQAADSSLTTQLGTTLWPSTSQLKGIAYVSLRLLWDEDTWGDGLPVVTALVKGMKCTDPRDTGAAVAHSANPAVLLYTYLRDAVHGPGLSAAALDTASFAIAAAACDEAVELATGLTEPRYTAHLTATHADTREAIIQKLLASCGGRLITGGSTIALRVGVPSPSEVLIGVADVLAFYQEETTPGRLLANTARGTYTTTPAYAAIGYPAVALSAWATAEGEHLATLDFPAVTSPTQAQRLAKLALLRGRRRLRATLTLPLAAYRLQVGDTITLTPPGQSASYGPLQAEITSLTLDLSRPAPAVILTLADTASADYAWSTTDEGTLPAPGTLSADLSAWRAAKLSSPSLDKPSQTFGTAGTGTITVNVASVGEPGATVRFTTDGTDPTTASTAWGGSARTFTATTTLKIIAHLTPLVSDIVTYTYTLAAPASITVTVSIPGGGASGTVTGAGAATEGDTITLTATGATGKGFIRWASAYKSEVNPLVFLAGAADINLVAHFGDALLAPTDGGYRIADLGAGGYALVQRIGNPFGQPVQVRWSTDDGASFTSNIETLSPFRWVDVVVASGLSWGAFTKNYRFADGSVLTYGQSPALSISYPAYP